MAYRISEAAAKVFTAEMVLQSHALSCSSLVPGVQTARPEWRLLVSVQATVPIVEVKSKPIGSDIACIERYIELCAIPAAAI